MSLITELSNTTKNLWQEPKNQVEFQSFPGPLSSEKVVENVSSIEGDVDVYCWFEGTQGLPSSGAAFMKESILKPLFRAKKDAKIFLYSLKSWDFSKNVSRMPDTSPLGIAINKINKAAIECVYSSSFFKYCSEVPEESKLYQWINDELPKKTWLFQLSENQKKSGKTIGALFDNKCSLFDCIQELDVNCAYSPVQYVEGYYLIQESVKRGLQAGKTKVQIAFVLPNDESKYYQDFSKDIEKMLRADFGSQLKDIKVEISFMTFKYGASSTSRPYIDKQRKAPKLAPEEVPSYFDYLSKPKKTIQAYPVSSFLRDAIHNLNAGI